MTNSEQAHETLWPLRARQSLEEISLKFKFMVKMSVYMLAKCRTAAYLKLLHTYLVLPPLPLRNKVSSICDIDPGPWLFRRFQAVSRRTYRPE